MSDKLVTIAAFNTIVEANAARSQLVDEGINSFIADSESVGMVWHLTSAFGGIKLQVMDDDAEKAISILESIDTSSDNAEQSWLNYTDEEFKTDLNATLDKQNTSPANELVTSALRAAILGLIFLPLQIYSLWLLLRIARDGVPLNSSQRLRVFVTIIINVWMIVFFVLLFWTASL
jgi:hypothetical protein